MRITWQKLKKMGACESAVLAVKREWPNGAEVNVKNAQRAYALGLDINWMRLNMPNKVFEQHRKATMAASTARSEAYMCRSKEEAAVIKKTKDYIEMLREEIKQEQAYLADLEKQDTKNRKARHADIDEKEAAANAEALVKALKASKLV